MFDDNVNLLEEINSISKVHTLQPDDIDGLMIQMAKRILVSLEIDHLSVWLFNSENSAIVSMGEYDLLARKFSKGNKLLKENYPIYFKAIHENQILLAPNVFENKQTIELTVDYFHKKNIISLMDIPIRIEGKLVGIMCFEKSGKIERHFSKNEQVFAMSIGMIFASTLEARQRRALQFRLKEELKEKTILIKEIHHRVKNNLSVVGSLINLQSSKAKDEFHQGLFDEIGNKVNSISDIHELIYHSSSLSLIDAREYFEKLLQKLFDFYGKSNYEITLEIKLEHIKMEVETILPLALIMNEVVTNSFKHAFAKNKKGVLKIDLSKYLDQISLSIKDSGSGFDISSIKGDSLGIEIIKGLVATLGGSFDYEIDHGTNFRLEFPAK
jgi:two-component sensor histidine kinase